jgi:membrane protease YdiL (CAAX protease family)
MYHFFSVDFSFSKEDLVICLPILCALVFFSLYWFIAQSVRIRNVFYSKYEFDKASYRHIIFTKFTGLVVMCILPIITCLIFLDDYALAEYGLTIISSTSFFSLVWIIALCMLVVPLVYFSARQEKNWKNYPQIRSRIWTKKMMFMNAVGWFVYLFGYEFLFRGVLLFPLVEGLGVWPAIAINIALYSATHIPKGLDETIGAAPLGLVLCILTLMSGTIWIAFFVHVAMAWTNSFTALKFNPETNYIKS